MLRDFVCIFSLFALSWCLMPFLVISFLISSMIGLLSSHPEKGRQKGRQEAFFLS